MHSTRIARGAAKTDDVKLVYCAGNKGGEDGREKQSYRESKCCILG